MTKKEIQIKTYTLLKKQQEIIYLIKDINDPINESFQNYLRKLLQMKKRTRENLIKHFINEIDFWDKEFKEVIIECKKSNLLNYEFSIVWRELLKKYYEILTNKLKKTTNSKEKEKYLKQVQDVNLELSQYFKNLKFKSV